MRGLKDKGRDDIDALISRTRREFAMGRISREDAGRLEDVLHEAVAVIANMTELDSDGMEIE